MRRCIVFLRLMLLAVGVALLGGCQFSDFIKITTGSGTRSTPPPSRPTPQMKTAARTPANNAAHVPFNFVYPVDVDVAYIRIKRAFGFKTTKEVSAESSFIAGLVEHGQLHRFRYEALPGVSYKMRNSIKPDFKVVVQVELTKEAVNKTRIQGWFNKLGVSGSVDDYKRALIGRLKAAAAG